MAELTWEGKYDAKGRKTSPLRVALPFQTVETVNESAQERQRSLDLFSERGSSEWRNRLIWGDKKYILPSLLDELAGQIDLIYIDPPFATGQNFSFTARVPESEESFTKEPSVVEQRAYRDTWGRGLDSYLQWVYETVALLRQLLRPQGNLFVHLGVNVASYLRAVLSEVLGEDCYTNEIVWKRSDGS